MGNDVIGYSEIWLLDDEIQLYNFQILYVFNIAFSLCCYHKRVEFYLRSDECASI